jgi:hypothetical protein
MILTSNRYPGLDLGSHKGEVFKNGKNENKLSTPEARLWFVLVRLANPKTVSFYVQEGF